LRWREVKKICDGVGGVGGGWFEESVVRRIGTFFFYLDGYVVGGAPLSVRFQRLFDLAENKSITVADVRFRVGGGWGGLAMAPSVVGVGGGYARGV